MIHPRSNPWLVLVLVALGLRAFYVPFHLAQEEHLWVSGSALAEVHEAALVGGDHGDHDHHGDHGDHDGDHHAPHSALDHTVELIAHRAQVHPSSLEPAPLCVCEAWSLPVLARADTSDVPERPAPTRWARPPRRSRAPPATA